MTQQAPAPGDLLISRRDADGHFEISIVPGLPQLTVRVLQEAVRRASGYAAKNGTAVWIAESDGTYVRVAAAEET